MIDWNKIIKSHVVKMFKKVCYKWWGMDIQFFDEHGDCKSKDIPLQNHFCQLMHTTEEGAKSCLKVYKKNLKMLSKSQRAFGFECHAGLHVVASPIFSKGKYVGSMVGSGIRFSKKDSRQNINVKDLSTLGLKEASIEQAQNKLKNLNGPSEEYINDFMELVAGDVIVFYEMLQEKMNAIRRQEMFQGKVYDEKYKSIIGNSPIIREVFNTLDLIENYENPVLIEGESGTGKELFAAAIHYNSLRKDKIFIIQNCSTFSDTLLSSELFGHEKGSFTGAISDKKGLFEIADSGTLFLDEIGEMDRNAQAKLLRVLEDGTFYRVGGAELKEVDVRVIVATNRELKKQVEKGLFREDLFYRINTIHITLPPLRERKGDVERLVNYFLESHAEIHNTEKKDIAPDVIELMKVYDWPGNIRELRNLIERLIILSGKEKTIEYKHLPVEIAASPHSELHVGDRKKDYKLKDALKYFEKDIIEEKLRNSNWNKTETSLELGISRASLNNKIEEYKIRPD